MRRNFFAVLAILFASQSINAQTTHTLFEGNINKDLTLCQSHLTKIDTLTKSIRRDNPDYEIISPRLFFHYQEKISKSSTVDLQSLKLDELSLMACWYHAMVKMNPYDTDRLELWNGYLSYIDELRNDQIWFDSVIDNTKKSYQNYLENCRPCAHVDKAREK